MSVDTRGNLFAGVLFFLASPLLADPIQFGETSTVGEGSVSSYVRFDGAGDVNSYGIKLTGDALNGLSQGPPPELHAHVDMPVGVSGIPVEFVDIHFLPGGHIGGPGNNYWLVPHFDFHFFVQPMAATATFTDETTGFNPLPDSYVPAGYILAPDSFVAGEGVHWVNPAEFGGPYTTNFIYGSYAGEMTFLEPMEALSFLEAMRAGTEGDFSGAIGTADSYQKTGLYPSEYSISYDAGEDAFYIEMSNLSQGHPVPEPSTAVLAVLGFAVTTLVYRRQGRCRRRR